MISLAHPAFLAVGLVLLLPFLWHRRRAWQYSSVQLLQGARRMGLSTGLLLAATWIAAGLLLIALAKPLKGLEYEQDVLETRDILLTLDLSLSMEGFLDWDGENVPPTKLELIRDAALDFVGQHPQDRLGLIVFGDDAFGVWPLSMDSTVLKKRLKTLDTLLPPALRGTHVAKALTRSLDHFGEMEQSGNKILLLLTDGLDSIETGVQRHLVRRLKDSKIKLYVLGMQLSESTSIVQLSREVDGGYFNINNAAELAQALRDIDRQERSRITVSRATESKDLYPYFVAPAMALMLLSLVGKATWVWEA